MADTPDLFNVGRKKKRVPKPKSPYAKQIQHIMLRVYFSLHHKKYGEKPMVGPREWGLLRRMVDEFGPDLVEARLRDFFQMNDSWVKDAGYSIGVFKSQWPKLAARAQQQKTPIQTNGGQPQSPCLHQPTCASPIDHSRRLVEEMRGQYRKGTPPTPSASSRTTLTPNDPF